jgi:hypothetical protein
MLGGKDPPSAETPHPGEAILDFSCTSILLSILYTATIHAHLVLHIVGSSYYDHHRVKTRVVVTNSCSNPNPRQSASPLLLKKLKFSGALLCRRSLKLSPAVYAYLVAAGVHDGGLEQSLQPRTRWRAISSLADEQDGCRWPTVISFCPQVSAI